MKNILNDIKKFKIKKMNSKTTKFILSAKRLRKTNSVFLKRYKLKPIFFSFGDKTKELNMEVCLYGSIQILPLFGIGGMVCGKCPYRYTKLN